MGQSHTALQKPTNATFNDDYIVNLCVLLNLILSQKEYFLFSDIRSVILSFLYEILVQENFTWDPENSAPSITFTDAHCLTIQNNLQGVAYSHLRIQMKQKTCYYWDFRVIKSGQVRDFDHTGHVAFGVTIEDKEFKKHFDMKANWPGYGFNEHGFGYSSGWSTFVKFVHNETVNESIDLHRQIWDGDVIGIHLDTKNLKISYFSNNTLVKTRPFPLNVSPDRSLIPTICFANNGHWEIAINSFYIGSVPNVIQERLNNAESQSKKNGKKNERKNKK